ncbi:GGDEF domain-containing protein [Spirulina sp. CS-785/01]|uniref:GGDEF domain-containing protein n=1 Tax=Spirulina sp. CS-785/01 TaxID=3021716 RepID=UPI00232F422F|nr:GGDEF domain-containing protein [Spirulina sp. CS-785/01]MDB9314808.1 GGDEF domain-containing protein [Spirulina sp. CS-785/01]
MFSHPSMLLPLVQQHCANLGLDSTIQDLYLDNFQVDWTCQSRQVAKEFERNPSHPGVILLRDDKFMGMISRQRFWELMGRPYSLELFSKRPLKSLYEFVRRDIFHLPGQISIVNAARQSLERPLELLTEPVVVEVNPQEYRLLDVHQLLVAQAHIHQLATHLLRESSQKLEQANEELERLAALDGLTEIPNRRRFNNYLQNLWYPLACSQSPLTLLLADVDFFKSYNDYYGHLAGDDCLRQVAKTLQDTIQSPESLVARYGGEEFVVVLPHCEQEKGCQLAQQIRTDIRQLKIPHHPSSVSSYVTVSIGGASFIPDLEKPPQMLIKATDEALYRAKQSGRDRYVFEPSFPINN